MKQNTETATQYTDLKFPIGLAEVLQNGTRYLFRVPVDGVKKGDHVMCKTKNGEMPGVVDSIIAIIPSQEVLDFILQLANVSRLEPVIGVTHVAYMDDRNTYYRGKGVPVPEKPKCAGKSSQCVTVHLPNGDIMFGA